MSAARLAMTLRARALRAGAWSFAGYGVSQAIRLGSNLLMARLLAPETFGVMTIAVTTATVLSLLSDLGIQQNIVQSRRGEDPRFLDSAWSMQILRGMALWLAALALSGLLWLAGRAGVFPPHSVYAAPELVPVIAVCSFSTVIQGFQSTRLALAQRSLDQKTLIRIELAGQILGIAAMVPIALATRSVWALVAGLLVAATAQTLLGHLWAGTSRLRWDRESVRELLRFGRWVFVSSAVYVLAVNGDRLLLGALVGADVLGVYAIALLIVSAIEGILFRLFQTVSLPAFSEVARTDPARLREIYYRMRLPMDVALLGAAGALAAAGPLVIKLLYDSRYAAAGEVVQVLALSLLFGRYGAAQQVYLALGRPRYLAAINAARLAALIALVPLAFRLGGFSVALWAIALHPVVTLPLIFHFNAKTGLNDVRRELKLFLAFPAGYGAGAVAVLLSRGGT